MHLKRAEILPHTPSLQRLFNREEKTKETDGLRLTFVYTTIGNIKYEEVFNNIILSIIKSLYLTLET